MNVIKRGHLLDVGLADLANDLFLLFKELISVNFDLLHLWLWLSFRLLGSWRIFLGLCISLFKFCQLSQLFFFSSLLFWVNVSDDTLPWLFVLW